MGVELRRAGPADAAALGRLVAGLLAELRPEPVEPILAWTTPAAAEFLALAPACTAFLAEAEGRVVGGLTLVETRAIYAGGRLGVIQELYVEPAWRSSAVGAALIEAARREGEARGWARLEVGAPDAAKWPRARGFYLKRGFREIGPRLKLELGPAGNS